MNSLETINLVQTTRMRTILVNYLESCLSSGVLNKKGIDDSLVDILDALEIKTVEDIDSTRINNIKEKLMSAQTADFTLNFIPNDSFITKVFDLYFKNTNTLLHFTLNKSLSGGFMLYYNGKVLNYSLEKIINTYVNSDSFKTKIGNIS